MRVLVTGAAGFLGRHFVDSHIDRGDDVIGVDDMSNPHSFWPSRLSSRKPVDLAEWLSLDNQDYDLVYHFAAPVGGREKIEGDPLFNADSLRLDSALFRWAVGHTPLVVYPSSSAVYGTSFQGENGRSLTEGMFHAENPNWYAPDEMYGFTKLAGEILASKAARYGLSTLCIRPFSGYGEDQSLEYPVPSIARRAAIKSDPLVVWGSGEQTRDFVHVDDVVGATLARVDAGVAGYDSMNIGSGWPTSFLEIAKLCAEIVGYHPEIVTDPSKPQGVAKRWSDTSRMSIYYTPKISLREGMERVVRASVRERVRA